MMELEERVVHIELVSLEPLEEVCYDGQPVHHSGRHGGAVGVGWGGRGGLASPRGRYHRG